MFEFPLPRVHTNFLRENNISFSGRENLESCQETLIGNIIILL